MKGLRHESGWASLGHSCHYQAKGQLTANTYSYIYIYVRQQSPPCAGKRARAPVVRPGGAPIEIGFPLLYKLETRCQRVFGRAVGLITEDGAIAPENTHSAIRRPWLPMRID